MVVEMSFEEKLEAIQLKIKNAVERINTEEINTILRAIEDGYILVKECEMDDTISRQDVLDAVGHGTVYDSREIQQIIKDMPPVR